MSGIWRGFLGAAIASLTFLSPAFADTPPVHQSVLSNGLKVILIPDNRLPFAGMSLDYGSGFAQDPPGKQGVSSLTWSMAHDSSLHISSGEADRLLSKAGATRQESKSSQDFSYEWVQVPSNSLALPLWIWSDRMGFFVQNLSQGQLEKHRELLRAQYQSSVLNTPCGRCLDYVRRELFPTAHPYANAQQASVDALSTIQLDDIQTFHPKMFNPANAVLAIAGNIDEVQLLAQVKRYFEPIPSLPVPPRSNPEQSLKGETRIQIAANIPRTLIKFYWATPALYAEEDAALDVLSDLFRGGVTNLLNWRIKQQHLATSVWATQASWRDRSMYRIELELADGITEDQAITAIDSIIADLKRGSITEEMCSGAVNGVLLDFGSESYTQMSRAKSASRWLLVTGRTPVLGDQLVGPSKVTRDKLTSVVKRFFGPNRVLLVVTPSRGAPIAGELRSVMRGLEK